FEAMLGWEAGQLPGQSTRVLFPDAAAYTTLGDTAYAVMECGGVFRTEMRYLRHDGLVGWADVTGAKLYPDGDETIWSFIDISERKRAELELEQSSERVSALSRRLIEVQEAERAALARELHDEIGQVLTAVRLHLKVVEREDAQGKHRESLDKALSVVERAIGQVRGLSLELRPPVLDDLGLLPALRWLALQQSGRGGGGLQIDIEVVPEGGSVPRGVAEAAYRIVQEALTNVLRHADARRATIRLEQDAERLAVSIRDDGRGFDPVEVRRMGGFGLLGMQERVKLAGGNLGVSSEPGGGTEVRAEFRLGS
ncbi:MAG: PAS domain-containing sensor histidine kinase, partial [Proteobacteria bacterium]|nr:PAS domain-containing sensor histidine kinase [Pseudomonadota bacterium]